MTTTHDMTNLGWGRNAYLNKIVDDGAVIHASLIMTPLPEPGDYIIFKNGSDTTRYMAETVEPLGNPRDMARAVLRFAPRGSAPPTGDA